MGGGRSCGECWEVTTRNHSPETHARQLAYNREWKRLNRDRVNATRKRWRDANPDKTRAWRQRWMAAHPEAYQRWRAVYNARRRVAHGGGSPALGERLEASLAAVPCYAAAKAAVPAGLPRDVRMDVVSTIVLAVLEGELAEVDIPAKAPLYVRAYWRDNPRPLSLDAPMPITGRPWVESLASDCERF